MRLGAIHFLMRIRPTPGFEPAKLRFLDILCAQRATKIQLLAHAHANHELAALPEPVRLLPARRPSSHEYASVHNLCILQHTTPQLRLTDLPASIRTMLVWSELRIPAKLQALPALQLCNDFASARELVASCPQRRCGKGAHLLIGGTRIVMYSRSATIERNKIMCVSPADNFVGGDT